MAPDDDRPIGRILTRRGDDIFKQSGSKLTLSPAKTADGYAVTFDIGLTA